MSEELVKLLQDLRCYVAGNSDVSSDFDRRIGYAIAALTAQQEPVAYGVFNAEGFSEFIAGWEELAHEHINDAINEGGIDEAAHWVVRKLYTTPPSGVREGVRKNCEHCGLQFRREFTSQEICEGPHTPCQNGDCQSYRYNDICSLCGSKKALRAEAEKLPQGVVVPVELLDACEALLKRCGMVSEGLVQVEAGAIVDLSEWLRAAQEGKK